MRIALAATPPDIRRAKLLIMLGRVCAMAVFVGLGATFIAGVSSGSFVDGAVCTPQRPHDAGSFDETIETSDGTRAYRLHVPPSYTGNEAVPLVLSFHGIGGNAGLQESISGFSVLANTPNGGFIVVYPEGSKTTEGGLTRWNTAMRPEPIPDDVLFIDLLLDTLEAQLCIDTSGVFATGFSNGAGMSVRLACSIPERVAAIAPVAGAYFPPAGHLQKPGMTTDDCLSQRPVPIIGFHGTADTIIPFAGGPSNNPAVVFRLPLDSDMESDNVMQAWASHNGCGGSRQESQVNSGVRLITYGDCINDAIVQLYAVDGGGHNWPDEVDTTGLIWSFFQGHPLAGKAIASPTPTATLMPESTATPTAAPTALTGDANCDAEVNSIDAALALQLSAGLIGSLPCEANADVNGDAEVSSIDAALILQFIAGLLASLPP